MSRRFRYFDWRVFWIVFVALEIWAMTYAPRLLVRGRPTERIPSVESMTPTVDYPPR